PAEPSIRSRAVSFRAQTLRHVEHDRDRNDVIATRELDQWPPSFGLYVGRVHYRQQPRLESLRRDEVKHLERRRRPQLIGLVVRDETAAEIRRDRLEWLEVLARERGLPTPGCANEHDERQVRDGDRARWRLLLDLGVGGLRHRRFV